MNKILESKTKVRFQDCDPFNHLNNSKYIDYFINAREDHVLNYYNLDISEHIAKFYKGWLVASNQITYIKPALMMEEVIIESQLIHFSSSSLKVEMKMWNKDKTVLKSIIWTSLIYFEIKSQKKAEHSEELINLFKEVVNPVEDIIFENRCYSLIQTNKASKL